MNLKSLDWDFLPGEGAFYGPKIEFSLKDCLERVWQCGTIQVDFSMPGRLGASYIDDKSQRKEPVMLHRAILGSFERFIGILIEEYEGKLPPWLAPIQVVIIGITDRNSESCINLSNSLIGKGFRSIADTRNEKVGLKIREHTLQRIPYLLIIGDKEQASSKVSVRTMDSKDLGVMTLDEFEEVLKASISQKATKRFT